ncbi:SMODS-associated NUDIX domain-containing protein [Herbidospora sp. RD11066]
MLENIVAGLITAAMLAAGALLWRYRRNLGLLWAAVPPGRRLRVSVAVILRVKDDDGYVLFHHPHRPQTYGPPGGVVKYTDGARRTLDELGFVEQRIAQRDATMYRDLRGFIPARRGIAFLHWYDREADRESAPECLRRELREELVEVGHSELAPLADDLRFDLVRNVCEGARPTPNKPYRTLRVFTVFDVVADTPAAVELLRRLHELARDATEPDIVRASSTDIQEGRSGPHLITPPAAFLLGDRRIHEDLPALR